jgi:hypothetical protein
MNIAAELQQEATQRAGSHEGFQRVIRLVLEDVERGETKLPSFYVGESSLKWNLSGQCESRVARLRSGLRQNNTFQSSMSMCL